MEYEEMQGREEKGDAHQQPCSGWDDAPHISACETAN